MPTYYRKQIFQDGELLSISYVDKDGVELTNFIPSESDIISPTPPPFTPDWRTFNTSLLLNAAYNRIRANTANQVNAARLESTSIAIATGGDPNYQIIKFLWDEVITGSSTPPTPEEIAGWNEIASQANMVFSFNNQGLIELE